MDNLLYWVWLTSIPGLGSVKISKLLNAFGEPEKVWNATESDLKNVTGLNRQDIFQLCNKNTEMAEKIMIKAGQLGIRIVTIQETEYPSYLRNIYDPPHVLYVYGELPKQDDIAIAVVGSRNASPYGQKVAEALSYQLAKRGIIIVSGMARGIDTYAHKGALNAGKRTIAVLGCGVDVVYPKENKRLAESIAKNGALISEYPPGTYPSPGNFPARNRIISGLCYGTVVVEAGEKSGALITSDFALEQGREIFAVPGNIDSKYSKGTNRLIKQGAKLVTCEEDVLEELPQHILNKTVYHFTYDNGGLLESGESMYEELDMEEIAVIEALSYTPVHIDQLYRKLGYSMQKLSAILMMLEMKGFIYQIPGKFFIRR